MATIRWVGGAAKVAQVKTYTFAGTWVIGNKITFTTGVKQWVYTITSSTIATFFALMVTAYNALSADSYQELEEMTAGGTSPNLTLTADEPGKSFACTISTDSALGTIDAGVSSAGVATTANGGPQSLASVKNYDGGALPVNGDTLIFDHSENNILYELDALSAVTLTARRIYASFLGKIGLPKTNIDGELYPEYRAQSMAVGVTTDYIGEGEGQGSTRLKLNYGIVQTTANVFQSQTGDDELPAVIMLGTHAGNVVNITKGRVGCAIFGGEVTTILTLNVSHEGDLAGDANVLLGVGVTLGTVNQVGGTIEINSAVVTALNIEGGTCTVNGTGAVASLQMQGGTCVYNTTGTLGGNTVVAGDGLLSFDLDKRTKTVTNAIDLYGNGRVQDSNKAVTSLVMDFNGMDTPWGKNARLTRAAVA